MRGVVGPARVRLRDCPARACPLLAILALTACQGPPCGDVTCNYGDECVRSASELTASIHCATPFDARACGYTAGGWPVASPDRPGGPYIYCAYGTQPLGAPCLNSNQCVSPGWCSQNLGGVCVIPELCPGEVGGYRHGCTPRCDAPDASPCPADHFCLFGECTYRRPDGWCPDDTNICADDEVCVNLVAARNLCMPLSEHTAGPDCNGDGLVDCSSLERCGPSNCERDWSR